ncbi:hypothetical protein EFT18_10615 [Staphylococcus pseudintermedius]|nr:hypothetical protein [Staphylococcus pseudintermedius]MBM0349617.1 hypothetical protein [Staphylococcus pseudintermedius]
MVEISDVITKRYIMNCLNCSHVYAQKMIDTYPNDQSKLKKELIRQILKQQTTPAITYIG